MKKKLIAGILVLSFLMTGCASFSRGVKSISSDFRGGMERSVSVYTQDGTLIETIEGKIDIQDTDYGNKVLFDLDGKRYVFYNCSVVIKEIQ